MNNVILSVIILFALFFLSILIITRITRKAKRIGSIDNFTLRTKWNKIIVNGNQITSTSFFGKTKTFTFNYITAIKKEDRLIRARTVEYISAYHEKEKLFTVSAVCAGYSVLVTCLNEKGVNFINPSHEASKKEKNKENGI